ncbi:hypothetical protein AC1031_016258 [Aphanomyces cochlioides]|nr:hypothetical protein AC1031_016258 [Aphanomyces cochlioides]
MTKLNATKLDDKREKKRHLEDISESFETSKSSERPEGSKSAKITAKQEDLLAQSIAAQKSMWLGQAYEAMSSEMIQKCFKISGVLPRDEDVQEPLCIETEQSYIDDLNSVVAQCRIQHNELSLDLGLNESDACMDLITLDDNEETCDLNCFDENRLIESVMDEAGHCIGDRSDDDDEGMIQTYTTVDAIKAIEVLRSFIPFVPKHEITTQGFKKMTADQLSDVLTDLAKLRVTEIQRRCKQTDIGSYFQASL